MFPDILVANCALACALNIAYVPADMSSIFCREVSANSFRVKIFAALSLARCSKRIPATAITSSVASISGSQTTHRPQAGCFSSFHSTAEPPECLFEIREAISSIMSERLFKYKGKMSAMSWVLTELSPRIRCA